MLYNGNDVEKIKSGIRTMLENYGTYKSNVTSKDCGLWSCQEGTIGVIVEKFLSENKG